MHIISEYFYILYVLITLNIIIKGSNGSQDGISVSLIFL